MTDTDPERDFSVALPPDREPPTCQHRDCDADAVVSTGHVYCIQHAPATDLGRDD